MRGGGSKRIVGYEKSLIVLSHYKLVFVSFLFRCVSLVEKLSSFLMLFCVYRRKKKQFLGSARVELCGTMTLIAKARLLFERDVVFFVSPCAPTELQSPLSPISIRSVNNIYISICISRCCWFAFSRRIVVMLCV